MEYYNDQFPILNNFPKGDFVVLDFETVNVKTEAFFGDSVTMRVPCQIGLVCIHNGEIDESQSINQNIMPIGVQEYYQISEYSLLWLKRNTDIINSDLKGELNPHEIWKGCPEFPKIWNDILTRLGNKPIVAHMAEVERSCIVNACNHYGLSIPENMYFICTKRLSETLDEKYFGEVITGSGMRTLTTCCTRYGVPFSEEEHHDAYADAKATAELILQMRRGIKPLAFEDYENIEWPQIDSDILESKRVVLSGEFFIPQFKNGINYYRYLSYDERNTVFKDWLTSFGANFTKTPSLSKNTDIFLCGSNPGWAKIEKVNELNNKGSNIEVLTQSDILSWIGSENKGETSNDDNVDEHIHPFYKRRVAIIGSFKLDKIKDYLISKGAEVDNYGKLRDSITRETNYIIIGTDPQTDKLQKKDALIYRGWTPMILSEDDLMTIVAGNYDNYWTDKTNKKNLTLTYKHYIENKLEIKEDKNPVTEDNIYIPQNIKGDRFLLAQIIGNIGAYANNEIINASDSDKELPYIMLTDETIEHLSKGETDETIKYIEKSYNESRSDGLIYKFIAESELLQWIRNRCDKIGDDMTLGYLNEYTRILSN